MHKLELYTGNKVYIAPNSEIDTKENVLRKFPAALTVKHVVLTDEGGEVSYAIQMLSALCGIHGVSQSLSDAEKIEQLEAIMNAPAPEATPSAEERIAAILEFQTLESLPDDDDEEE